mmetsp:Transcript_8833/g.13611  ORF Transcript_8833/g.13611 Transcript_8833/m.13611 type:complete len:207 (-) Transcript_8833:1306-1926(-)
MDAILEVLLFLPPPSPNLDFPWGFEADPSLGFTSDGRIDRSVEAAPPLSAPFLMIFCLGRYGSCRESESESFAYYFLTFIAVAACCGDGTFSISSLELIFFSLRVSRRLEPSRAIFFLVVVEAAAAVGVFVLGWVSPAEGGFARIGFVNVGGFAFEGILASGCWGAVAGFDFTLVSTPVMLGEPTFKEEFLSVDGSIVSRRPGFPG